jgi:hypothetical protein
MDEINWILYIVLSERRLCCSAANITKEATHQNSPADTEHYQLRISIFFIHFQLYLVFKPIKPLQKANLTIYQITKKSGRAEILALPYIFVLPISLIYERLQKGEDR